MTKQSAKDVIRTAKREWPAEKSAKLAGSKRFMRRTFAAVSRLGLGNPKDCAELARVLK